MPETADSLPRETRRWLFHILGCGPVCVYAASSLIRATTASLWSFQNTKENKLSIVHNPHLAKQAAVLVDSFNLSFQRKCEVELTGLY